jgi:hypothetical protein
MVSSCGGDGSFDASVFSVYVWGTPNSKDEWHGRTCIQCNSSCNLSYLSVMFLLRNSTWQKKGKYYVKTCVNQASPVKKLGGEHQAVKHSWFLEKLPVGMEPQLAVPLPSESGKTVILLIQPLKMRWEVSREGQVWGWLVGVFSWRWPAGLPPLLLVRVCGMRPVARVLVRQ